MDPHLPPPRDHGGNLDAALSLYGGACADWLDLSTGINPLPYPVPQIAPEAWQVLPRRSDMDRLKAAAARAYGFGGEIGLFAGAQGAIQAIPFLRPPGIARVLTPTYNEHAGALRMGGWQVADVAVLSDLPGADLAVVVNPNNPDGARYDPADLARIAAQVGFLVVDESFVDPEPDLSLAGQLTALPNTLVLRSFGKFYGLAGVRLGFALGASELVDRLRDLAGPWPISGPAIDIACAALADTAWQVQTVGRLAQDSERLDALAMGAGWRLVGGTPLFRTYATPDAAAAQAALARHHIWSRIFPYDAHWLRLGLAGGEADWQRLGAAFAAITAGAS